MEKNVLEVRNLKKFYPIYGSVISGRITSYVKAVNGVSFGIEEKSTLGLVGESGCGKSTIGKSILLLVRPDDGEVLLGGEIGRPHHRCAVGLEILLAFDLVKLCL